VQRHRPDVVLPQTGLVEIAAYHGICVMPSAS
jgi:hypothetical protein